MTLDETVTVTPDDGGAGGTFTPSSVTLSAGTPSATFTYTPASVGGITIGVTNDGDLSDPASVSFSIDALTVITPSSGEVPLNVVITSETADLIYTVDDTAPTLSNGTQVASPVTLNLLEPCTVRAVATDGVDIFPESSGEFVYTGRVGDPRLIPYLIAWYRSDSVEVTGGFVSTWYDQSGNSLHATVNPEPIGGALPPPYIGPTVVSDVLNGFPVLRFDGVNSYLATAYQNFGQPDTFFVVAKQSSKATVAMFWSSWGDSHNQNACDTNGYFFISADEMPPNPVLGFSLSDSIDHSGAFHNFESIWNGASSAGWVDGTEVFTGDSLIWSPAVILIGRSGVTGDYLTGDIAEIVRYALPPGGALSVSDRKWMEAYLGNRYDLPNAVPFAPGPLNIAGLMMWLKADALALADDAEIASWIDSSENGHTASKGTAGPVFKTDILNGYPVARFSAGKWLNVSDLRAAGGDQPCTVIFVSKASGGHFIADHGGGSGYSTFIAHTTANGLMIAASTLISDGIDHIGAFHVFSVSLAGASTKAYVDGVLTAAGNAGPSGFDDAAIGAYDQAGTDAVLVGDIAELMIFGRSLADTERQEIEAYLAIKYGLA